MDLTDRTDDWVAAYERAWRAAGTDTLPDLFTADAVYLTTPYADPLRGLRAIARFWDEEREGPDEAFTMRWSHVAASDDTAVVRVEVTYGEPVRQEYVDLWVIRYGEDGRCREFEEWPFWPGHGRGPNDPTVQRSQADG
jgi:ketosteroid isomerase-like protein